MIAIFILLLGINFFGASTPSDYDRALNRSWSGSNSPRPEPEFDPCGAYAACQAFVERRLKSPASAEWPFGMCRAHTQKLPDRWKVVSWVDAQNAFGALIRTEFICQVRKDGATWRLVDMDIRGR